MKGNRPTIRTVEKDKKQEKWTFQKRLVTYSNEELRRVLSHVLEIAIKDKTSKEVCG